MVKGPLGGGAAAATGAPAAAAGEAAGEAPGEAAGEAEAKAEAEGTAAGEADGEATCEAIPAGDAAGATLAGAAAGLVGAAGAAVGAGGAAGEHAVAAISAQRKKLHKRIFTFYPSPIRRKVTDSRERSVGTFRLFPGCEPLLEIARQGGERQTHKRDGDDRHEEFRGRK
jgi:hypothetical protein